MWVKKQPAAFRNFPVFVAAMAALLVPSAGSRAATCPKPAHTSAGTFIATLSISLPIDSHQNPAGGIDDCGAAAGDYDKCKTISIKSGITSDTQNGARNTIPAGASAGALELNFYTTPPDLSAAEKYTQVREMLALSSRLFQRATVLNMLPNKAFHPYCISIQLPASIILFLPLAKISCSQDPSQCNPIVTIPMPTCSQSSPYGKCMVDPGIQKSQAGFYTQADQLLALSERFFNDTLSSKASSGK